VANSKVWLANTNTRINSVWSALTATNTAIRSIITVDKNNLQATNTALRLLISDRLQVANAAATYTTKAYAASNAYVKSILANTNSFIKSQLANTNTRVNAVWTGLTGTNTAIRAIITVDKNNLQATNTALRLLIADRLQVANAAAVYQTKAIERAALANTNIRINAVWTGLTGTNTSIRSLISDRIQVANAASLYATKANPTTNGLWAHTGRATISTNLDVSGNTSVVGLKANNSLGSSNYVLKTNGTSTFWGPPDPGVTAGRLVQQRITNTIEGNTVFTVVGGYTANAISVFLNGIKLVNGEDVTTTSGATITIPGGVANNDIIEIQGYGPSISASPIVQQFTAAAGDTTFTISGGYTPNQILVFLNGALLRNGVDVTVTSGTSIVMSGALVAGDLVDVYGFKSVPWITAIGGFKNAIINGDFNIWQRGTSFSGIAAGGGTYTADRWRDTSASTAAVFTCNQSTDVPTVAQAGRLINYSMHYDCTTADASIAAGDMFAVVQVIEGFNWLPLAQKPFTLSFWVKATKTGTYCVSFRNSVGDRSYVAEYTINASNTWEFKTITVPPSPSAGTWNYTNSTGLFVGWALLCGSTWQTTANSWNTGNFVGTANQVNAADSTSNDFRIAGVQLEAGPSATQFESRQHGVELALCQRYYTTIPVTMSTVFLSYYGGTAAVSQHYHYPVAMRTTPTLSITNSGVEYYSYAGVWTASTLVNWATTSTGIQVSCASDGDGRGKLMRSGSGGVNPAPILVLSAEL
jgi:hypothetical protein